MESAGDKEGLLTEINESCSGIINDGIINDGIINDGIINQSSDVLCCASSSLTTSVNRLNVANRKRGILKKANTYDEGSAGVKGDKEQEETKENFNKQLSKDDSDVKSIMHLKFVKFSENDIEIIP